MIKLLTLDIETSPIDAYTWGIWQQNVNLAGVKDPSRMLSWAAKWHHEDHVMYASERTFKNRRDMVEIIWGLVDEADAIIHYNGTKFDMKHLNREFILAGLTIPSPYDNIDLFRVVKQRFAFPSNKLDYVAGALGLGHKLENPGMQLWIDVLQNKKEAWDIMEDYNVQDVVLTEQLYDHLIGWISSHPNVGLYMKESEGHYCTNCGSESLRFKGYKTTRVLKYKQYRCNDCGHYSRERTHTGAKRKDILA